MKEFLTIKTNNSERKLIVRKIDDKEQVYITNSFPQVIKIKGNKVMIGKFIYDFVSLTKADF